MAASTWSTTDLTNVTLSGGNLIATSSAIGGVRGKDPKRSGKFYVEYSVGATQNGNSAYGFATRRTTLTTVASNAGSTAGASNLNGAVTISDVFGVQVTGTGNLGASLAGTVLCCAIDLDARLLWMRINAGNWNNSASNNPATGVGGFSLAPPGLGQGIDVYPYAYFGATSNAVTANFGASAFAQAVPSGYTSGWDDSVAAVSYAVATQLGIEEWAGSSSPVQAWLTQIAVEEWASAQLYAPPVTVDPNFANVVLLCHCDGTNGSTSFTDVSIYAHTLTAASTAAVSTTSPKFGTGCANYTGGPSANISSGNAADFNFGAGQFTVEAWGYIPSGVSGVQAIISQWGSSQRAWFLGFNGATLNFFYSTTGSDNPAVTGSYTPPTNQWIHFAADRDASNNWRIYANGVVIASASISSTIFASTANCVIGNDLDFGTRAFPGFLDEVRVTKGVARYAGAFLPPSTAFPGPVSAAQARALIMA